MERSLPVHPPLPAQWPAKALTQLVCHDRAGVSSGNCSVWRTSAAATPPDASLHTTVKTTSTSCSESSSGSCSLYGRGTVGERILHSDVSQISKLAHLCSCWRLVQQ